MKEACLNKLHTHKGKTIETINREGLSGGEGGMGWIGEAQLHTWQWNYSIWYCNGGHMTLCMCQNPHHFKTERGNLNAYKFNLGGQVIPGFKLALTKEFDYIMIIGN